MPDSLVTWKNAGNIHNFGPRHAILGRNPSTGSATCREIPYSPEQGIFQGVPGINCADQGI
jgi:hypothetical protein